MATFNIEPPSVGYLFGRGPLAQMKQEATKHKEALAEQGVRIVLIQPNPDTSKTEQRRALASIISAQEKQKTFRAIGVACKIVTLPHDISVGQFGDTLDDLNQSRKVTGVIVQLPVPRILRPSLDAIQKGKDIDGITAGNGIFPICATAEACLRVLRPLRRPGDRLTIVGGKGFVGGSIAYGLRLEGQPYAILELGDDLTQLRDSALVISTTGSPNLLDDRHLDGNRAVVDVGFTPLDSTASQVAGDVNKDAYRVVERITPVPGGVGPMQMAVLIERMLQKSVGPGSKKWVYPEE